MRTHPWHSFWNRARSIVAPGAPCLQHFIDDWEGYSSNVVQEAEDRIYQKSRGFYDYLRIRRHTSGSYPTLALCEFGLDLPEEVYRHPLFVVLRDQAADLIALINVSAPSPKRTPISANASMIIGRLLPRNGKVSWSQLA